MHKDWGNSRISSVIVNPTVVADQAYAPYGEVYNSLATGAGVPAQMFTGDTQDIIGGIFDTPNRELNASQGRWLSPDPAGVGWNQYAYPTNPNSLSDPSGLGPMDCVSGESDPSVSGACQEYTGGEYNHPSSGYSGPPDDWGAEWEQEALAAYVSWVTAIEQAGGGGYIAANGRTYSLDWSTGGGVFWVSPSGNELGDRDVAELGLGALNPDYSLGGGQMPTVGGIPGLFARSPNVDIKCNGAKEVANMTIGGPMAGAGAVVDISFPTITVSNADDIFLYSNPSPWGKPGSKTPVYNWTLLFGSWNPGVIKWTFTVTSTLPSPWTTSTLVGRTNVTCGKAPVQ